ncbi:MAG: AraC family transcriptional regulator ligand-binding domain-containing protein [Aquabacterium sp.]|nr:AraC family transcriptional regulator ligand-binding domain-containing protein [Aquabacterium sp.]
MPHWLRAASLCDIDLVDILRREGIDAVLSTPDQARIARPTLERIMAACVRATWARQRGLHFPLVLADTFAFEYMPDMASFVSSAPTLRDAARILDLVPTLFDPGLRMRIAEQGHAARLQMQYIHQDETVQGSSPFVEAAFALCIKLSRTLQGGQSAVSSISFRHAAHEGSSACERFFGAPVSYGAPIDALWFDRAFLDRRLRGAVEALFKSSAERLEAVRQVSGAVVDAPVEGQAEVHAQLAHLLARQPELLQHDLAGMAAVLGLHPRTLQRRLRAEGRTFGQVLDQGRLHWAQQWLGSMTVEEVALKLGFADRTGFSQAFARWTGMTPAQFRKR